MGGISTGTGIFSGIDSASLINQLLAIEARPKQLAQQRVLQLQQQQAAYLGLNSKIGALKAAAAAFRTGSIFQSAKATSSNENVLTATASKTAVPGSYAFIVDQLVSTQQFITRGFADDHATGINAGSFTFEPAAARLDRDTALADLNGGSGVKRGKIVISDSQNRTTTIDLSRAATVEDVLDAVNSSGAQVTARVDDDHFVIASTAGATLSITSAFGYDTAASLGIATTAPAATVTGSAVYTLGTGTSLGSLNDGNGVFLSNQTGQGRYDFSVTVGGTAVNVNIGTVYDAHGAVTQSAVTTLGGAIDRINSALSAQFGTDVTVSIASDGASLQIHDAQNRAIEVAENPTGGATTARDLGLLTSSPQTGTVSGGRLIAGMNSTLLRTLNGGRGLSGTGALHITARDGTVVDVALPTGGSLEDVLSGINSVGAGKITASLNKAGTGLLLTDHTAGGGNLIVGGDSAASLGIATAVAGVAADTVEGTNLQHQYLTQGTLLSSLRSGAGVGTGSFRITDSTGASQTVSLTDTTKSVDDLIKLINSRGLRVKARVNDQGDGILLYEDTGGGALKIKVEDVTGSVASGLGLAGEASGTGVQNTIDGSQERKVTFAASDTLQSVATKINAANLGVAASVISDGGGSTPFRLSLTAKNTGSAGRFVLDTGGFDLGQTQLDAGQDARVFFGSSDPAKGILLSSSSNTLDQVITGVSIDLASASDSPVTLTITRDNAAIESAVNSLVKAFNDVTDAISDATKYDQDSNTKGVLLGDATTLQIRSRLYSVERANAIGISGPFSNLADIGITVGQNGDLTLSSEKFRAALQQNFQGVADVLTARVQSPNGATQVGPGITVNDPNAQPVFTSLGLAGQLENMADGFINSVTGTLTRRGKTLADQIDLQHKRIAAFDEQLANKKTVLQRQFLAMEQAIGQLQTQSQALSGLRG